MLADTYILTTGGIKDEKTKKGFKFCVCCALMISSMIGMFGCRLENGPYDSPCSEWRSEDPDMSFTVGQESGLTEKIYGSVIIEGQEYCMYICFSWGGHATIILCDEDGQFVMGKYLEGQCKYSKEKMVLKVDKKKDKIFNYKYSKIVFTKTK